MQIANEDVQALRKQVRAMVDRLPQRDVIANHDARFWCEEVVDRYGALATWHAARAGGFGGSQIGALVRNHLGQRADHSSAHDIVEGALLRRVPDEPNGHMQRGIWMEPHHREMFYARWGALRDEEGFKKLSSSTGPRTWMRYSPDELCFMSGVVLGLPPERKLRVLGDFKAPTTAHKVNFEYQCQLGMGNQICRHIGLPVDALILSQFDWANWGLLDQWVDVDEELEKQIVLAGDHYWNGYVMRGQVPPHVLKPRLDPSAPAIQELAAPLTQLARLKALKSHVEARVEKLEAQIKPKLAEVRFGEAKLVLGGMSYSAQQQIDLDKVVEVLPVEALAKVPLSAGSSKRWDEDKLVARLRDLGVRTADLKDCLKPGNLDAEGLREALGNSGLDADALVTEKLVGRVDKDVAARTVAWAESHVTQLIGGAAQTASAVETSLAADDAEGEENDREGLSSLRQVPGSRF